MHKEKSEAARELYSILEPTLSEVYSRRKDGCYLRCVTDLNELPQVQADRFRTLLQAFPDMVSVIPQVINQELDSDFDNGDQSNAQSVDKESTPIQLVRLPSLRKSYSNKRTVDNKPIEMVVWHFYHLVELAYTWDAVEEYFFSELNESMNINEDDWYIDEGWLNFKIEVNCELFKWARLLQIVNRSVKLYTFPNETWLLVEKKLVDRYKYTNSVKRRTKRKNTNYLFSGK